MITNSELLKLKQATSKITSSEVQKLVIKMEQNLSAKNFSEDFVYPVPNIKENQVNFFGSPLVIAVITTFVGIILTFGIAVCFWIVKFLCILIKNRDASLDDISSVESATTTRDPTDNNDLPSYEDAVNGNDGNDNENLPPSYQSLIQAEQSRPSYDIDGNNIDSFPPSYQSLYPPQTRPKRRPLPELPLASLYNQDLPRSDQQ